IYQTEAVSSPFIMGFVKPKIYIPYGLDPSSLEYVLAHEKAHIKRLDHIVKPISFLVLTAHWFNPLVWLSFYLMSRDMEMSCDEKVLVKGAPSKDYSTTLLSLAVKKRFPSPSPLAFGESGVKGRIKNALKFKKPALWITVIAVIICIAVIFICAADPKKETEERDVFGKVYSTNGLVCIDGMFSYVPEEETMGKYYVDSSGTLHERGWYEEEGWREVGTFAEFELTKSNFDSYYSGAPLWEDEYSASKLRKNNVRAWEFSADGNFYYLLEQNNGEVYLVIGHDGEEFPEPLMRWAFLLEPTDAAEIPHYPLAGDSYVSYQCLYMNPLSSIATIGGDSGYRYVFVIDEELAYCSGFVRIDRKTGNMMSFDYSDWGVFPYSEEEWNDMCMLYPVDISGYVTKEWMQLNGSCALAMMDSQHLWFVEMRTDKEGNDYIWSIYSLVPEEYMGSAEWDYSDGETMKIDFNIPGNMTAVCTQSDISTDGVSFDVGADWSDGSLYWSPLNDNGEPVLSAQIHYSSDTGYAGTLYIVGSFSDEGMHYTVETSGTGLHIENAEDGTVRVDATEDIFVSEPEPTRDPIDFTVDNTGEDFFRYEDIEGRTMGMYRDRTNAHDRGYSFRAPKNVSECSQIIVVGEIYDKYYADGGSVYTLGQAATVYDFKIEQVLRGDYVPGDLISISQDSGYYRWYVQEPKVLEWAAEGNPKYVGTPEVGIVTSYGGIPEIQVGEKYVMFLHVPNWERYKMSYVEGTFSSVGNWTGIYKINDDGTVSRYIDAERTWTYGTLEELIQEVKENPYDEDKFYDIFIDVPVYD
ncbi:MAG: M56 family metallopeptidase, partial [Oscillospiraceae bacterium]|nr:M56 family metallopeptidase [Oscillospiraceae bacterium]